MIFVETNNLLNSERHGFRKTLPRVMLALASVINKDVLMKLNEQ